MDVWHAWFGHILNTVAVAIREDRADNAGIGCEDAASDEDAHPGHVRPHSAGGGVGAVDAIAREEPTSTRTR